MNLRPGSKLQHFKGQPYQFLFFAAHSESLDDYAVYECLYENQRSRLWIRPRKDFEGLVPEVSGAPSKRRRFAELIDEEGEPERLTGCSNSQLNLLAARHNALSWQGIDEWDDATAEEREQTLESAFASLALLRETEDAMGIARAHWMVAYILLLGGRIDQAAIHASENIKYVSQSQTSQPVDRALSAEIGARIASLKGEPEALQRKESALALIKALTSNDQRAVLEQAFEKGPW